VLVVGAGISGISAACHLARSCPEKRFTVLERRERLGGTWDLFRYPGIRSDSDMHTLGFGFRPWTGRKAIADGADILRYLEETAREHRVDEHIELGRHVRRVEWSSDHACWTVDVETTSGARERWRARYLWFCAGYYDYDHGYTPDLIGRDRFGGTIIHPQHWPTDFDPSDRRIVVIGSGATAFTLVPALAREAAHVTMLQRSPTYVVSLPSVDRFANALRRSLPDRLASVITRAKNVALSAVSFRIARRFPARTKRFLIDDVRRRVPSGFDVERHFTPTYQPWDQRICAVPDSDFFNALTNGSVSIETDHIDTITETGIRLASGTHLECDVIVTATGLNIQMLGGAELVVDGQALNTGDLVTYKGAMYAGVPNLSASFGYVNASWTLKADLIADFTCRVLRHMDAVGARSVTPRPGNVELEPTNGAAFSPGYVKRSADIMPRRGTRKPWRLAESYPIDLLTLRCGRIDDEVLLFEPTTPSPVGRRMTG
jgi:cation diffusion facilitator CzcD-associated flavoprotein CzcO